MCLIFDSCLWVVTSYYVNIPYLCFNAPEISKKKVGMEMYRGMNFLKYQMQLLLTTVLILEIHDMNSKMKFYVMA